MSKEISKATLITHQPTREWKQISIGVGRTLIGYSRAADRTFFHVPELKMALDAGLCRGRQPDFVFVTHAHIDHSIDTWYMAQNENAKLFIPKESIDMFKEQTQSTWELNLSEKITEEIKFNFVPVSAGEEYEWGKGNMYTVKILQCVHKVPCVGYAFSDKRTKLKEQYKGLPGKEIAALKKQQVEITDTFTQPMFIYMGDTSTKVFELNPWVFEYPIIIIECTFIADEHERAERDGHVHWDLLCPYILAHPQTKFVLIHFSLRYSAAEVLKFFDDLVSREVDPLVLDNVSVLVGEHSAGRC